MKTTEFKIVAKKHNGNIIFFDVDSKKWVTKTAMTISLMGFYDTKENAERIFEEAKSMFRDGTDFVFMRLSEV